MTTHQFTLGPLLLTGSRDLADLTYGYWFEVAAEGTEFGTPEATTSIVTSLLSDGAIQTYDRDGNRTIPLRVMVHGPTLEAVAQGEAALRRETKRASALTWQPPDDFAPASVYESYPSPMRVLAESGWDLDEKRHRYRTVALTLTCAPYARSVDKMIFPAIATAASTPTTIDDCSSATGWTATIDGISVTPAASSGSVRAEDATWPKSVQMRRAGTIDFTGQRYLLVEVSTNARRMDAYAQVSTGAVKLQTLGARLQPSGWVRYVFDTEGATVSSITFVVDGQVYGDKGAPTKLWVNDLSKAATPPQVSPRQLSRTITPGGTERTPATIHVSSGSGSAGCGLTVVHTSPETGVGYNPSLDAFRISGNTVTNGATDTFSGSFEPIHANAVVYEIPTSAIPPGEYELCAMLKTDVVGTHLISWSAQTRLASSSYGTAAFENDTPVQFYDTTNWHYVSLTPLSLPTMDANAGAFVRIAIQYKLPTPAPSPAPTIIRDTAWVFRTGEDCALSVSHNVPQHLWLDAAGVVSGAQEMYLSTQADRSDQWHPGVSLFGTGNHVLSPDGTAVYTATRDRDNALTEAEAYTLWHTNVASVES